EAEADLVVGFCVQVLRKARNHAVARDPGRGGESAIGWQRQRAVLKLVLVAPAVPDRKPGAVGDVMVALEVIGVGAVAIRSREEIITANLVLDGPPRA